MSYKTRVNCVKRFDAITYCYLSLVCDFINTKTK